MNPRSAELSEWEGHSIVHWEQVWRVPELTILSVTASTNDVARLRARAGAAEGTVVIADEQTAGRGRSARTWVAPAGAGLLLSVVLRVDGGLPGSGDPGPAPIRVGFATAAALRAVTGLDVRIKWPNDIVLAGKGKLGGILCEAATRRGVTQVIAGIGINVHQRPGDFPTELRPTAASLHTAGVPEPDRARIAGALLDRLRPFRLPGGPLDEELLAAWHDLDALAGRQVSVDGAPAGTAHGIASDGSLRIRGSDGLRTVRSGTVRLDSAATHHGDA